MSPYDAYEQARKEYAHLPQRMRLRRDLIASRALQFLGVMGKESISLMITYSGGKTRDRVVAAYEHHLNRTMNKTKERQAMKYPACSTCKNEPYQAGAGGPCATCAVTDVSINPSNFEAKRMTVGEFAKTADCFNLYRRADELRNNPPIQKVLDAMATQVGASPSHVTVESPMTRKVLGFLNDLCHPDQFGYAVTKEVRQRARQLAAEVEAQDSIP